MSRQEQHIVKKIHIPGLRGAKSIQTVIFQIRSAKIHYSECKNLPRVFLINQKAHFYTRNLEVCLYNLLICFCLSYLVCNFLKF